MSRIEFVSLIKMLLFDVTARGYSLLQFCSGLCQEREQKDNMLTSRIAIYCYVLMVPNDQTFLL